MGKKKAKKKTAKKKSVIGQATSGREDFSRFVIHLTRDDQSTFPEGGATAKENFQSIITELCIRAYRPLCLYGRRIPEKYEKKLSVSCFTEVPLTQLHLLTREIPGRDIKLEPYGLVFSREFLLSKGAQPAIYINSYSNQWLREASDRMFEMVEKNNYQGRLWRFLPFINAMHERYDFTWEREWRIRGDLDFKPNDVICAILPKSDEYELKKDFATKGIPVISPGLSYEEIVGELSSQQRHTKRIWIVEKLKINRPKLPKST